ncbi:DNA ligase 4 [Sphaceloma murrayae]|uniref:DNA ligase 4 n=1 Tax=Sphaceloma murrayae TaxID=2082308 RepID=A0A2K1QN14_9PEZI|nr:DNA ligase 4 [Sphaceloma murrayae]
MALKFSVFSHLLTTLEDVVRRDPPLLPADSNARLTKEIQSWFRAHRRAIDGLDVAGAAALLSSFLPERRTDRVYGLQQTSLCRLLCRGLGLSSIRSKDLNAYKQPGHGDLGICLERVLQGGGPPALPTVTLEEVDRVLLNLASGYRYSSPAIRSVHDPRIKPEADLINIIRRLHPAEAKWLVRLVLKDLSPVRLSEQLILKSVHFLLPDVLRFQHDFDAAVETLKGPFKKYPSCPDAQSASLLRKLVAGSYRPRIGIKISRSNFTKARSIEQCLQIINGKRWMIERKYDGEYCEIHVDLSKGQDWLKIFSKSGKDSTQDRLPLKEILRKSLALGSDNCKIKSQCVLLGEMVVYSNHEKQIMPFHKIRKYVTRSGTYLGTSKDSPRHAHEHLMIVFFDLLLLDEDNVMQKPLEVRKSLLQGVVRKKAGRAIIAESKVLDFSDVDSKRKLMSHLAASVAARHEGLVVKPCGRPYLAIPGEHGPDTSTVIKLKKDYITGLGDELDLAVVGASHDAQLAAVKALGPTSYTHFHLGCLTNQEDVERFQARPHFKIVATISADGCIPPTILPKANSLARQHAEQYHSDRAPTNFDLESDSPHMQVILRVPFVFEILGSSYDKPSDCGYYMLRHPRVKKLHEDRTWIDCVSFIDLQKLAKQALSAPVDSESQENIRWIARIEASCRRKIARASAQTTPTSPLKRILPTENLVTTTKRQRQASPERKRPLIHVHKPAKGHIDSSDAQEMSRWTPLPVFAGPVHRQCAFLTASSGQELRSCPLSGAVVCVDHTHPDAVEKERAKEVAELHGATVCESAEELLAAAEGETRAVMHAPLMEKEREWREAKKVAMKLWWTVGEKGGVEVELLDVWRAAKVCAQRRWEQFDRDRERELTEAHEDLVGFVVRGSEEGKETSLVCRWDGGERPEEEEEEEEEEAVVQETQEADEVMTEGTEAGEIYT